MIQEGMRMSGKEMRRLFLLVLLLVSCMGSVVNAFTEKLLPKTQISIRRTDSIEGRNATILYEEYANNPNELFLPLKKENENGDHLWKYVKGVPGESWTMLVDTPECSQITVMTEVSTRKYLTLLCNRGGGTVEITAGDQVFSVDCFRDQDNSDILRIYPFEHSKRLLVLKTACYSVLFVLFFLMVFVLYKWFKNSLHIPNVWLAPVGKKDSLACFVILSATALFIYKVVGIPNYLQQGDEIGYWTLTLLKNGKPDLDYQAGLFSARGYWCYIPQNAAKFLAAKLSMDPSILWILQVTFWWSILLTIIFPGIYRELSGKEARRIHLLLLLLPLLTTWRHFLTCVLMDGLGMITFFGFLYGLLSFFRNKKPGTAALTGMAGAISCSFRTANIYGVTGFLIYELVSWRKEKGEQQRKCICGLAVGILSFVILCIPQFAINLHRDHVGLLPHDNPNAFYGQYVTLWSSDWALHSGNIAYPLLATDDQMRSMKNKLYYNDATMNAEQLTDIYLESPVETLMLIIKKLIIGFDIKTNVAFPGDGAVPWRESRGMLFSLWNYFLLFSGLYALGRSGEITGKEKWMAGLVFFLLILPETYMKIEWRYVMPGYFLLYYFFAFYLAGPILEDWKKRRELLERSGYLTGFCIFAFAYLTMSFIFLA